MASLPSVVLGFLAALVFAPFVEKIVPTALACLVTVPLTFLLGAYLWQLLPQRTMLRFERFRLLFLFVLLPVGLLSAWPLGPLAERLLFAGDLMSWLDGQVGNGTGAWLLLCLPASGLASAALLTLYANPWLRRRAGDWTRRQFAIVNLGKFVAAFVFAVVLAYCASFALNDLGFDPRGSFVDTYVQRNALVVGFVMGFAVIPIIYTIADDALTTVPDHLRSASLGCGATPWQTAYRVVIPTAMSGLFSALMIGLGRAVGETMIVLMAGGNTPVTDWNIFNGFRTLSANIAVELPEAVRDSTHYRTLFLAALTLFVLTFLVNTVAEVVRQRFRRRAYQL
jgi:phosphate transport system permease protein